jgi:hypothetical protein
MMKIQNNLLNLKLIYFSYLIYYEEQKRLDL